MAKLKDEGKIRHIGISNVTEEQFREAERIVPIVSIQNRFNVTDRRSAAADRPVRAGGPGLPALGADPAGGRKAAVAVAAQRRGVTERQVVLAWLLASSPAILPIPGTGSPEHAEENVAAVSIDLSRDEIEAISEGGLRQRPGTAIVGGPGRPGGGRAHRGRDRPARGTERSPRSRGRASRCPGVAGGRRDREMGTARLHRRARPRRRVRGGRGLGGPGRQRADQPGHRPRPGARRDQPGRPGLPGRHRRRRAGRQRQPGLRPTRSAARRWRSSAGAAPSTRWCCASRPA